nr:hypothetical protein GCM10020241_53240 [Streptoalloteichus tenebrarius]
MTDDFDASTAERERVRQLIGEAMSMPVGDARCELLERAARLADAAGDVQLGVLARLELVDAYSELRRNDLMLAPFAWCRNAERRTPEAFDESMTHWLNWQHKWLPGALVDDPRFGLRQVEALVDDLAAHYQRQGFSAHPVHGIRVSVAAHVGDEEAEDRHYAAWLAAEPDRMSNCAACVVEAQVDHLVRRERFEEAVRHAEPVLSGETTCREQPHGVLTALLPALLATGRTDFAAHAHLVSYRAERDVARGRTSIYHHLWFCAVTDNVERGLHLLRRHLDMVTDPPTPRNAMSFAANAALLLSRVPLSERRRIEFTLPSTSGSAARTVSGEELREELERTAWDLAARFDARNGTDAQSRRIARVLGATEVIPVQLPVPGAPVGSSSTVDFNRLASTVDRDSSTADSSVDSSAASSDVPVGASGSGGANPADTADVADPVTLAERAVAALDEGEMFDGARLLERLPADLDPLLPPALAARVAAHRLWREVAATPRAEILAELERLVERLRAEGEHVSAIRFECRAIGLLDAHDPSTSALARAERALRDAEVLDDPSALIAAHLTVADVLSHLESSGSGPPEPSETADTESGSEPDAVAGDADGSDGGNGRRRAEHLDHAERVARDRLPRRLGWVRVERASLLADRGDRAAALALLDQVLAESAPAATRYAALRARARLLLDGGRIEEGLTALDAFAEFAGTVDGPWHALALLERAFLLDHLDRGGDRVPDLVATVASARRHLPAAAAATACLYLAGGYLSQGRSLEAAETLEEGLRLAGPRPDEEFELNVRYRLGFACGALGEHAAAAEHFGVVAERMGDNQPGLLATVLDNLGRARTMTGDPDGAAEAFRRAADLREGVGDPVAAAGSLVRLAQTVTPDLAAASAALDRAVALTREGPARAGPAAGTSPTAPWPSTPTPSASGPRCWPATSGSTRRWPPTRRPSSSPSTSATPTGRRSSPAAPGASTSRRAGRTRPSRTRGGRRRCSARRPTRTPSPGSSTRSPGRCPSGAGRWTRTRWSAS